MELQRGKLIPDRLPGDHIPKAQNQMNLL